MRIEGLTKRFGSLVAVKNLNLEVYEGEVLGFLGPNGAGKTTSINMMCGLLKPDAGQVMLYDEPITSGNGDVRARIGLCPQEPALWGRLTAFEQMQFVGQMYGMGRSEARKASERLLAEFGLADSRNRQVRKLSGGMQRRLNVALAIVHDPEVVILDEPEVGLDPQSRVSVREYIRSLSQTKTIILTTHNMDEADRLSSRIAIIDHGELMALDTPEALKRSIGDRDVLEIRLQGSPEDMAEAEAACEDLSGSAALDRESSTLVVRGAEVVRDLPSTVEKLTKLGLRCGEVRLRQTTLEDVFIHLTGRSLRK
jgi:ABC-2 type transport system ATP-binding protein